VYVKSLLASAIPAMKQSVARYRRHRAIVSGTRGSALKYRMEPSLSLETLDKNAEEIHRDFYSQHHDVISFAGGAAAHMTHRGFKFVSHESLQRGQVGWYEAQHTHHERSHSSCNPILRETW